MIKDFNPSASEGYITLSTHNKTVEEKNKKEFNKLFGAYNLRSVQLEEMWVKLLNFKIIETSEYVFNVDLYKEISTVEIKDIRNAVQKKLS